MRCTPPSLCSLQLLARCQHRSTCTECGLPTARHSTRANGRLAPEYRRQSHAHLGACSKRDLCRRLQCLGGWQWPHQLTLSLRIPAHMGRYKNGPFKPHERSCSFPAIIRRCSLCPVLHPPPGTTQRGKARVRTVRCRHFVDCAVTTSHNVSLFCAFLSVLRVFSFSCSWILALARSHAEDFVWCQHTSMAAMCRRLIVTHVVCEGILAVCGG